MKTKEDGVTLVALVTTIILLLILATVGVTVGSSTIDSAKFTKFKSELKIIQNKVNDLNQKNETDIGQELNEEQKKILDIEVISNIIYKDVSDDEKQSIQEGFRYCDSTYIQDNLALNSVKREYLINVEYRYVISKDGFEYEGTTYYMIDQIENEIYNVRYNDKNEKTGSFEVTATKEDGKWKIDISNISYNGYVDNWQVKYQLEGASYWETSNDLTFYVKGTGNYTVKVVHGDEIDLGTQTVILSKTVGLADGTWNGVVNKPKLEGTGLIPIYFDESGNVVELTEDNIEEWENWYDYDNKKWANAITKDTYGNITGYWVWIPRYAYQIESGCYTSTAGTINIKFLQGTTNKDANENEISKTYPTVTDGKMEDYVVHPVFTDGTSNNFANGEWDSELPGFWVAKYPAGYQANTITDNDGTLSSEISNGNDTVIYSDKKYTTYNSSWTTNALLQDLSSTEYANQNLSYPVFKPLTYAYNIISTGDSYTISQEIVKASDFYGLNSRVTDSHLMKNSEWGAIAYLTQSNYGRNAAGISLNSTYSEYKSSPYIGALTGLYDGIIGTGKAYYTSSGVNGSSTGNITGIYDLNGCVWERIAGYISDGATSLENGNSYVAKMTADEEGYKTLSTKYATVYPYNSASDTSADNWTLFSELKSSTYGYGDAILETSTAGSGNKSWNNNYSYFPSYDGLFVIRGIGTSKMASVFSFSISAGFQYYDNGFRSVLVAK